jgi:hypothetical protein
MLLEVTFNDGYGSLRACDFFSEEDGQLALVPSSTCHGETACVLVMNTPVPSTPSRLCHW